MMRCFLTEHTPVPRGENLNEFDNCIWVNQKTPYWRGRIRRGDRIFVYEVVTPTPDGLVQIGDEFKSAYPPRGGLVSCFIVTRDFIAEDHPIPFNGKTFVGKFQGHYISQAFVPYSVLKESWLRATGKEFIPHIMFRGGIRELNLQECNVLSSLMSVERCQLKHV